MFTDSKPVMVVENQTNTFSSDNDALYTFIFQDESQVQLKRSLIEKFKTSTFYVLTKDDLVPKDSGYYLDTTPDNFIPIREYLETSTVDLKDKDLDSIYELLEQFSMFNMPLSYDLFSSIQLMILNNFNMKCMEITTSYPIFSIYYPKSEGEEESRSSYSSSSDHYTLKKDFHIALYIWNDYYDRIMELLENTPYLSLLPIDQVILCFTSSITSDKVEHMSKFLDHDFCISCPSLHAIKIMQASSKPSFYDDHNNKLSFGESVFYNSNSSRRNSYYFYQRSSTSESDYYKNYFVVDKSIAIQQSLFFDLSTNKFLPHSERKPKESVNSSRQPLLRLVFNTNECLCTLINNKISVNMDNFEDRIVKGHKLSYYSPKETIYYDDPRYNGYSKSYIDRTYQKSTFLVTISFNSILDFISHPTDVSKCPFVYITCATDEDVIKTIFQNSHLSLLKGIDFQYSNNYALCKYVQPSFIHYKELCINNLDPNWIILDSNTITYNKFLENMGHISKDSVVDANTNASKDDNKNSSEDLKHENLELVESDNNSNNESNNNDSNDVSDYEIITDSNDELDSDNNNDSYDELDSETNSNTNNVIFSMNTYNNKDKSDSESKIYEITVLNRSSINISITDDKFIQSSSFEYNEAYKIYRFYYTDKLSLIPTDIQYKYLIHPCEASITKQNPFSLVDMNEQLMLMIKDMYKSMNKKQICTFFFNYCSFNTNYLQMLDELFMNDTFKNIFIIQLLDTPYTMTLVDLCKQICLYIQQKKISGLWGFDLFATFVPHCDDFCKGLVSTSPIANQIKSEKSNTKEDIPLSIRLPIIQCYLRSLNVLKNKFPFLDLKHLELTDDAIISILDICIEENILFERIDISHNKISDSGINKLITYIKTVDKDHIKCLSICYNLFTETSFKELINTINTDAINLIYFDALLIFHNTFECIPFTFSMINENKVTSKEILKYVKYQNDEYSYSRYDDYDEYGRLRISQSSQLQAVKELYAQYKTNLDSFFESEDTEIVQRYLSTKNYTSYDNYDKYYYSNNSYSSTTNNPFMNQTTSFKCLLSMLNIRNNIGQFPTRIKLTNTVINDISAFDTLIQFCKDKKMIFVKEITFDSSFNVISDSDLLKLIEIMNQDLLPCLESLENLSFDNIQNSIRLLFIDALNHVSTKYSNIPSLKFERYNQVVNKQYLDEWIATDKLKRVSKLENVECLQYDLFIYLCKLIQEGKIGIYSFINEVKFVSKNDSTVPLYKDSSINETLSHYEQCIMALIQLCNSNSAISCTINIYFDYISENFLNVLFDQSNVTKFNRARLSFTLSASISLYNSTYQTLLSTLFSKRTDSSSLLTSYDINQLIDQIHSFKTKVDYYCMKNRIRQSISTYSFSNLTIQDNDVTYLKKCIQSGLMNNITRLTFENTQFSSTQASEIIELFKLSELHSIEKLALYNSKLDTTSLFTTLLPLFKADSFLKLSFFDLYSSKDETQSYSYSRYYSSSSSSSSSSELFKAHHDSSICKLLIPYLSKTQLITDCFDFDNVSFTDSELNSLLSQIQQYKQNHSLTSVSVSLQNSCSNKQVNNVLMFIYTNKIKLSKLLFGGSYMYLNNTYYTAILSEGLCSKFDFTNVVILDDSNSIDHYEISSAETLDTVWNICTSNSNFTDHDIYIKCSYHSESHDIFTKLKQYSMLSTSRRSNFFSNLKRITCTGCSLGDNDASNLSYVINRGLINNLNYIDFSSNSIADTGATALTNALYSSSIYLTELNISSNRITKSGRDSLNTLRDNTVGELNHRGNAMHVGEATSKLPDSRNPLHIKKNNRYRHYW